MSLSRRTFETNSYWIGFNDLNKEGTWAWTDGSVTSYTNWNSGEPSGGSEHCGVLRWNSNGTWNDAACSSSYGYICKYPLNTISCAEWKRKGYTSSGYFTIDPDGRNNGVDPYRVYCDMTTDASTSITKFEHQETNRSLVIGFESAFSFIRYIRYGNKSVEQVATGIDISNECYQYIKYECHGSYMTGYGAWYDRDGNKKNYWGGATVDSGQCACRNSGTCANGQACNCNVNDNTWREDAGYLTDKTTLPVTELRFGDTGDASESGYYTIEPLYCKGDESFLVTGRTDFMFIKERHLSDYNNEVLSNVTSDQCATACASASSYTCRSFDYSPSSNQCWLSEENDLTVDPSSDSAYHLFVRIGHMNCSAPFLPKHSTVHHDLRLNYNFGDRVTVTCDANDDVFILQCHNKGLWSGPVVSCPEPANAGHWNCSPPYISKQTTIQDIRLSYGFGDTVTVTCDANDDSFILQCHNNGLWSGSVVSCPEPLIEGHWNCSPPYISKHVTIQDVRLSYNFGDRVTITCDANDDSFTLQCHKNGLWNGSVVSCPEPTLPSHAFCSAPAVPPDSTIQNLRLSYKDGDTINVTCNNGPAWFDLSCNDGIWSGQNIVCPDPVLECNPPIIPVVSSIENVKPRYKIGDEVNITCNDDSRSFVWECHRDGLWRGFDIQCSMNSIPSAGQKHLSTGRLAQSTKEHDGRDYFITGLLVTAVILFILVLMCMAAFFIFMRNRSHNFTFSTSSKDTHQDEKGDRGPLPDVPEGYANYIVGDQSLYVEPYLKQNGGDQPQSYEVYEKPV